MRGIHLLDLLYFAVFTGRLLLRECDPAVLLCLSDCKLTFDFHGADAPSSLGYVLSDS